MARKNRPAHVSEHEADAVLGTTVAQQIAIPTCRYQLSRSVFQFIGGRGAARQDKAVTTMLCSPDIPKTLPGRASYVRALIFLKFHTSSLN